MKFNYDYFTPNVGDLVVDGADGTHGVVVQVGPWHTFAYFVEQGPIRIIILQVALPEYDNMIEQYSLKCIEKDDVQIVESPLRFISREDINELSAIM